MSNFGIICITRENVNSPWVLFEAGALAKSMQDSRVIPLLLDLEFSDITGPLAQFQAKKVEQGGISEVIQSINKAAEKPIPDDRTNQLFDALWPKLETHIKSIPKQASDGKHARPQHEILEELVSSIRSLESRYREAPVEPGDSSRRRRLRHFHPMMIEDMLHMGGDPADPVGILMAASLLRDDAPWLYELAMEAYRAAKAGTVSAIESEIKRLRRFSEYGMDRMFLEEFGGGKELHMLCAEFPRMLDRMLRRILEERSERSRRRSPQSAQ